MCKAKLFIQKLGKLQKKGNSLHCLDDKLAFSKEINHACNKVMKSCL